MAATLILSPQAPSVMTSRRQALADIPHAINSPNRGLAALATKRTRSYAADQRELAYGQPPPAKKRLLQTDEQEARRNALLQKTSKQPPTALQQKLDPIRDTRQLTKPAEKRQLQANLEDIRQWQRHYRKVFPQIVFYFDNVPEEIREKIKRQVKNLGSVRLILTSYCAHEVRVN
jgi:regulatory subunit for Cdc7p protein kinase